MKNFRPMIGVDAQVLDRKGAWMVRYKFKFSKEFQSNKYFLLLQLSKGASARLTQ